MALNLETPARTIATSPTINNKGVESSNALSEEEFADRRPGRPSHPITQLKLTWLLLLLTAAVFILTVYYAFNTKIPTQRRLVGLSPANTILIIRVLSGVTGFLMVALVASSSDRISWMLVARKKGSRMSDFLALSATTDHLGLLAIIFFIGKNLYNSRGWALLRLVVAAFAQALSIIILSKVEVRLVYLEHDSFPVAAGVGFFDPSIISQDTSRITGVLFATDFSRFLSDPLVSYPTTPVNPGSCANGGIKNCVSSYFVTGGLEQITPWPSLNKTLPESPLYTVSKSSGYQFDFSAIDPAARFDGTKDCIVYGSDSSAVQFCLTLSNDTLLNMKWLNCPFDSSCLKDVTWQASTGFTASMQAYRRTATVHYSRYNSSIYSIENLSRPRLVKLDPQDLFRVYNSTFTGPQLFGSDDTNSPFISYLNIYLKLAQTNSQTISGALLSLRNLAVLPLYYFQANNLDPALQVSPDAPAPGLPEELYTTASLTDASYRLVVNPTTLYIYTAGGALVLALCTIILVLGSLRVTAKNIPKLSVWTVVGLPINCVDATRDTHENSLPLKLQEFKGITGSKLLKKVRDIRLYSVVTTEVVPPVVNPVKTPTVTPGTTPGPTPGPTPLEPPAESSAITPAAATPVLSPVLPSVTTPMISPVLPPATNPAATPIESPPVELPKATSSKP